MYMYFIVQQNYHTYMFIALMNHVYIQSSYHRKPRSAAKLHSNYIFKFFGNKVNVNRYKLTEHIS